MEGKSKFGKFLRIIAVIILALTAAFHLMGGIGTSCVAFGAEKYDSMTAIVPFKWLYIAFVVVETAMSIYMIAATVGLARRKPKAYKTAVLALVIGLVLSGIHMFVSQSLRGSSAPNNMRFYLNALTLVVFLLLRIPGLWERTGYGGEHGASGDGAGLPAAMMVFGTFVLNIQHIAGATHTWDGINFADVWHYQLSLVGWGLIAGAVLLTITRALAVTNSYTVTDPLIGK